jgi:hypothetical protein
LGALVIGVALLCGGSREAAAQWKGHDFGLGLRLGDPSAVSGKFWLNADNAIQVDVGWHAAYRHQETTYANYYPWPFLSVDWVHQFARFGPASRRLWFATHIGAGGVFDYATSDCYYDAFGRSYCQPAASVHVPIAFNLYFSGVHFEIFVEVAPGLRFYPASAVYPTLSWSGGARYYF